MAKIVWRRAAKDVVEAVDDLAEIVEEQGLTEIDPDGSPEARRVAALSEVEPAEPTATPGECADPDAAAAVPPA